MQKITLRTIITVLAALTGACVGGADTHLPGTSDVTVLPDHTTPLSFGNEGLVVNVRQTLIGEYWEIYTEGGVAELAFSEFLESDPGFLTLMIDLPVAYPEGTTPVSVSVSVSGAGASQSEMNSWYGFLSTTYGAEKHAHNLVQIVGDPSSYVEDFPMLRHVVAWLKWEFQLYFEISEAGTARGLMVCEPGDVSGSPDEDGPQLCLTIFRHNGVVLLTRLYKDRLSEWQDYRTALTRVVTASVTPRLSDEDLREHEVRFDLRFNGVTIRPVLGSDLGFRQDTNSYGVTDIQHMWFDASTNLDIAKDARKIPEILISDAGKFVTEIGLRLFPYRDDREREAQTLCETTQYRTREGQTMDFTNCEFDFVYRSLWDVAVTYRSATGSPWPINAGMVTRFLDTIVDPS